MITPFITDMGEKLRMTNAVTDEIMELNRYAYWDDMGRRKPEVKETSDDLEYLKKKYNVPDNRVVDMRKFKSKVEESMNKKINIREESQPEPYDSETDSFAPGPRDRTEPSKSGGSPGKYIKKIVITQEMGGFVTIPYNSEGKIAGGGLLRFTSNTHNDAMKLANHLYSRYGWTIVDLTKKPMKENIITQLVKECIAESKAEKKELLKKSLRRVIKEVLIEGSAISNNIPEKDKEEKEKESKGYKKGGNEALKKNNYKLLDELEKLAHGIDPDIKVYWDDYNQLRVDCKNRFEVRIKQIFEDNFNIEAMVKLEDRVYAIGLSWQQVKDFVKANFSDFKDERSVEVLKKRAMDHLKDKTDKSAAGMPDSSIKNRGEKANGEDAKLKTTKKDDKDYKEDEVKKDEDQPDQPMKTVDPIPDNNRKVDKTPHVKPPKHKNDKKLVVKDKKTPKFKKG